MVTIYDVAKRAGVSPATVSRVFGGQTPVTANRAAAVQAAAAELGFVPNRNARRLRTSSSEIIAMMVPDIANPFYMLLTRAVEDVARAAGYSVMLCNTDEDPAREQEYLRVAASEPVAGIIITPGAGTDLGWALTRGVPVVCVDRHPPRRVTDAVVVDNTESAAAATRRLYEAGYHQLACITGPDTIETSNARLGGFATVVRSVTGAEPDPALILRARYVLDADGERAAAQLMALPDPPDAIFAANNRLATGTLRALHRLGLLPPAVGLVSFGGPPSVLFTPPGVVVTYLPTRDIGTTAAHMLLERIAGLDIPPRSVTLPVAMEDPAGDNQQW
ncbi:MAG: LacI family transcriptional regulator [Propionibacteriaceae bacterium]|jgi:LacI family transcriptional regulator|nr:LacI family transcriptional regulator [Propionibacteriaceae bacterium]